MVFAQFDRGRLDWYLTLRLVLMPFDSLVNALNLRPDPDLFGFFRVCETRCAQTVADFFLKNAA